MYEASCLGTNGGLGLDSRSCGRGPRESFIEGEDVDDSSRRRRIELVVIESEVPRVTLRNEGWGVGSSWTAPRKSRYSGDHFAGQFQASFKTRICSMGGGRR